MGFNNQSYCLNQFLVLLLIFFAFLIIILSSSSPSLASCNEILPKINSTDPNSKANQPTTPYQVLNSKNTAPFFLNKPADLDRKRYSKRKNVMKRRKINYEKSNFKTRPFFVMLPKGFVPPSGSSPCHNDKPDSSAPRPLICGLSTTTRKP